MTSAIDCTEAHVHQAGAGPPLLIINGNYQDQTSWKGLSAELEGSFRVITFDFPNQGRMPVLPEFRRVEQFADYAEFVIERLELDPSETVVLGFSAGASVIRYLATERQYAFKAHFLLGMCPGGLRTFYSQWFGTLLDAAREDGLAALARMTMFVNFTSELFQALPLLKVGLTASLLKSFQGREQALEALLSLALDERVCDPAPGHFSGPAFFLRGERDVTIPKAALADYIARCSGAHVEYVETPGAHAACLEFADETAALIVQKLRTLKLLDAA
jgi:pimeloyl-ACP methyl ester carboxylesterase